MNDSRLLKGTIVILLLLNLGTLAFLWMHKPPGMQQGPPPPPDVFGFLTHELNLTDAQQSAYRDLRDKHREVMDQKNEHAHELRKQFFQLLQDAQIDTTRLNELAKLISGNQGEIELTTFYHFRKVRELCTPEQQKKFDEVIDEALRMLARGGPGRR